jgi:hypothetical protein
MDSGCRPAADNQDHRDSACNGSHLRRSSDGSDGADLQSYPAQKWRGRRSGSGGQRRNGDGAEQGAGGRHKSEADSADGDGAEQKSSEIRPRSAPGGHRKRAADSWRAQEEGGADRDRPLAADVAGKGEGRATKRRPEG